MEKFKKDSNIGKIILTKEIFIEKIIALSPNKGHWLKINKAKFNKSAIVNILNNPQQQMAFLFQFGAFPKEFFDDQYEKACLNMEWSSKDENAWKNELRTVWKEWLQLYQKELKEQLKTEKEVEERLELMKKFNPIFCLRNYLLEESILEARKSNYQKVNDLLKLSENPFDRDLAESMPQYFGKQPDWAEDLCVSCSS